MTRGSPFNSYIAEESKLQLMQPFCHIFLFFARPLEIQEPPFSFLLTPYLYSHHPNAETRIFSHAFGVANICFLYSSVVSKLISLPQLSSDRLFYFQCTEMEIKEIQLAPGCLFSPWLFKMLSMFFHGQIKCSAHWILLQKLMICHVEENHRDGCAIHFNSGGCVRINGRAPYFLWLLSLDLDLHQISSVH